MKSRSVGVSPTGPICNAGDSPEPTFRGNASAGTATRNSRFGPAISHGVAEDGSPRRKPGVKAWTISARVAGVRILPIATLLLLAASGCGYHTAGTAVRLPADLHTIAVPTFINGTEYYRVEQIMTEAVVREFNTRTNYRVVSQAVSADATLNGRITSAYVSPVTYDSTTGRTTTAMVTMTIAVRLVDKKGNVVFEQPGYQFREEYEVSRDITTFFQEETPAVDRMAGDFARELVSNVLEAF